MTSSGSLGDRLRSVRKRSGLTQNELASSSGVSVSLIRQIEQGAVESTRLETLRKLATAMRVTTSALSPGEDTERARFESIDHWTPIRRALVGQSEPMSEVATPAGVQAAFDEILPALRNDRYTQALPSLTTLIRDADSLGVEGRGIRTRILSTTGWLLTHTHQYESAKIALERALDEAPDRLEASAVVNNLCWLFVRQGRLDECLRWAVEWCDELEPRITRATTEELSAWGWMLIRLSMAAIRDNRNGEALDAIRFAKAAALAMGGGSEYRPGDFLRSFSSSIVACKRVELAMIEDQPTTVLKLSEGIQPDMARPNDSNNWNRHRLDMANAYVRLKQPTEALGIMREIRHAAPEWLIEQRYARDILTGILEKRRTLTGEMRELADFVGLAY